METTVSVEDLADPNRYTLQQATALAVEAAEGSAGLSLEFIRALAPGASAKYRCDARNAHILNLIAALPIDRRAKAPLRNLLNRADQHFQAKLILLLARIGGDWDWLIPFLSSPDDRLRANAVEGLWNESSDSAIEFLRAASKDNHHRVAANAFVGLHRVGDPTGLQGARTMIANASPLWRAAGAWALGLAGGEESAAELRNLMNDSDERVRGAALRSMVRLRKTAHLASTKSDS